MKQNSSSFFWVGKDEVGGGLLGGHWQGLLGFGWGGEGPERPLMAFVRLPQESTLAHFMLIPRLPTLAKPPLPHWHANSITADFRQRQFFIESSHRIVFLKVKDWLSHNLRALSIYWGLATSHVFLVAIKKKELGKAFNLNWLSFVRWGGNCVISEHATEEEDTRGGATY